MDEHGSHIIEVTGIDKTASKDRLELYFSSLRHGANITRTDYNQGSGYALITVANAEGAKKILEKGPHSLNGHTLKLIRRKKAEISENEVFVEGISTRTSRECLMLYMERISDYLVVKDINYIMKSSESVNAIVRFHSTMDFNKIQEGFKKKPTLDGKDISIETVPTLCKTILVKNVPVSATYESVLSRFKNEQGGGGEVERIHLDLEKRIAWIEFKYPNVAKRVVTTEIIILGEIVDVELVDTEAGFWKKESGTVLVSGLPEGATENHVHIHFQRKENGGGEVEKVKLLPGKKAMVVFEDIQVAIRVVNSKQVFKGKLLDVKLPETETKSNNEKSDGEKSAEKARSISRSFRVTENDFHAGIRKEKSDEGNTLNIPLSLQNFDKIKECFRKKLTLAGKHISIKTVPLCRTVLVKNLPTTATYDSVLHRFEDKRVGGGEVEGVHLDLDKRIALVEFKYPNVIDKVLSVKQTLDNTTLSVERYYPILGSLADLQLTEQETSDPTRRELPTVKPRHPKATSFTEDIDRDLYLYLKDNHPAQLSFALKDPQPNIEIKNESVHFTFSNQDAKQHFLNYLKGFKYEIVPVNPVLLNHGLREEIKEIISVFSSGKSVSFIERYNEGFIKLVGRAMPTFNLAIDEVKKCTDKVEKRTNRREEILPVHLKLLRRSTRFQRLENSLKRDGCEIQLDGTKGRITAKGSHAQIQKLKVETEDIVGRFGERSLNQSKFSLLKTATGLSHVKTLFPTEKLMVEVLVNDQGNVMLYGMDQTQAQRAYNTIENAIGELKLPPSLRTKSSQDALLNELGASIPLTLQREEGQPRIICFKKHLRNLSGKVDDFLERKKTVEVGLRYPSLHGINLLEGRTLDNTTLSMERFYPIQCSLADLQLTDKETSDPTRRKELTVKPRHSLADLQLTDQETSDPTRRKELTVKPRHSLADLQLTDQETSDPTHREVLTAKPRHQKPTGFTEDIDRDLYFYLKDNHPAQLSLALKDPQPNIEIKNESVHFIFSNQDAKEHFLNYLKGFKYEIVPVNTVLAKQGLNEEIKEIISVFSSAKSVSLIERYNEGFIKLVGRAMSTFDLAIDVVKKCISTVEERTSRREDVIEILPVHFKLLRRSTRFQRLENSLKRDGCEIQLDGTKGRITVKGSQAQIQKLKVETQDIVRCFGKRSLNQSKFSLLKTSEGLSYVKSLLSTENLMVEILVNDRGSVMLYGMDQTQVQQAYNTIENAIGELKLPQMARRVVTTPQEMKEKSLPTGFLNKERSPEPMTAGKVKEVPEKKAESEVKTTSDVIKAEETTTLETKPNNGYSGKEESAEKARTILISDSRLPEGVTENDVHIYIQKKKDGEGNTINISPSLQTSNTEVQWTQRSIKHGSEMSEFVKLLKTNPLKAKRIGTYRVCFDDKFSIGQGSDGTKVYVGLSDDGYEVAVKCMNLEKCWQMGNNEKKILNCPNVRQEKHIVNYRFFYQPVESKTAYLVLDLHEESLRDYVLNEGRSVEQLRKECPNIISQILYGVRSLHCGDPEILHRDLKPSNILVTVEGEMVLADFGISRTLPEEQTTYKSGVSGTEGWMAMESLPNEEDDDDYLSYEDIQVRYKKQSDIQVVGMLCYYVLTKGRHPYGKRIHRNYHISKGNFDLKDLSDPCARDLITWMLQHDPGKRPNVHKCLKHPYLRTAEENFKFVTCVGNEREIKTKDATSIVVQVLNKLPVLTDWLSTIERCVMNYMTAPRRTPYTNDAADLLRFMRNMAIHWRDKTPPANVQNTVVTPQEYFERKFPTLAFELHRIIRGHSDWTTREGLKEYF